MAKQPALPTIPQRRVPQFGRIQGGLLDGWSYGRPDVEIKNGRVLLHVRATQPRWCFPTDVVLDPRMDFDQLQAGPGALVHESKQLIAHAIEAGRHGWNT